MKKWSLLLFCLFAFNVSYANIPKILHFFHESDSNYSKEDAYLLKSWKQFNPKWRIKIWTTSDFLVSPFEKVEIYYIKKNPLFSTLKREDLKRAILNQEGGIWVHEDLVCCKSVDSLARSSDFLISKDKNSLLGSISKHPLLSVNIDEIPEEFVLSDDFIFPDQIFTTQSSLLPQVKVCFWKFNNHPTLNREFKKIHSENRFLHNVETHFDRMIYRMKVRYQICILIAFLNGILLILCFPYLVSMIGKYKKFVFKSSLFFVPLGLCILFSKLPSFLKFQEWNCDNLYHIYERDQSNIGLRDIELVNSYHAHYSHYFSSLENVCEQIRIPHIIHVIWGGPRPFPEKSIANLISWKYFHPSWTFKFWTEDPSRPVPVDGMEKHLFSELTCPHLEQVLQFSENWGEKSDIFRYEILFQEGGLYIDHDIECFRSFDSLHSQFDFYASLEPLHLSPIKDSHVSLTNCIIGAKQSHTILRNTIDEVLGRWDYYACLFPDRDKSSMSLKTLYRTFDSFQFGFDHSSKEGTFIFPPFCLFRDCFPSKIIENLRKTQNLIFGNHQWKNSWLIDCPDQFSSHDRLDSNIRSSSKKAHLFLKINSSILLMLSFFLISIWIVKKTPWKFYLIWNSKK